MPVGTVTDDDGVLETHWVDGIYAGGDFDELRRQ
jgi:hypothetical protein